MRPSRPVPSRKGLLVVVANRPVAWADGAAPRDGRAGRAALAVCAVIAVLASACSSGQRHNSKSTGTTRPAAGIRTTAPPLPPGPAADLSKEITGGQGPFIGEPTPANLKSVGYVEHEYVASGTATAYKAAAPQSRDGRWTFEPDTSAAYRTRILVRRPASAAKFSGTVVVEWLNVSGGVDANPDYASLEEEITRQGDVWVGVSAQIIGVEGGPALVKTPGTENVVGKGLKTLDPARYGSLEHPGDGYSFDIYTQVARALREGGPPTGGVTPQEILAAGESQSAIALTTYYDGVQPLTRAFDGFFVHSRGSVSLPLVAPGKSADLAGSIGNNTPAIFRTDLDAPVIDLQAESDVTGVLKSVDVRQPDSDRFRLWEVAGTAHADVHLLGATIGSGLDCGVPINNGPMHLVAKAALRSLEAWVAHRPGAARGTAPRRDAGSSPPPFAATPTASPSAASALRPWTCPWTCSPAPRARTPTCSAFCWARPSPWPPRVSPSFIRHGRPISSNTTPTRTGRSRLDSSSRTIVALSARFADPSRVSA